MYQDKLNRICETWGVGAEDAAIIDEALDNAEADGRTEEELWGEGDFAIRLAPYLPEGVRFSDETARLFEAK